jgi:hypothetical protein
MLLIKHDLSEQLPLFGCSVTSIPRRGCGNAGIASVSCWPIMPKTLVLVNSTSSMEYNGGSHAQEDITYQGKSVYICSYHIIHILTNRYMHQGCMGAIALLHVQVTTNILTKKAGGIMDLKAMVVLKARKQRSNNKGKFNSPYF